MKSHIITIRIKDDIFERLEYLSKQQQIAIATLASSLLARFVLNSTKQYNPLQKEEV